MALKYSSLSQIHGTRELIQKATSYCFGSTLNQFQPCQLFSFLLLKHSWKQPSESPADTGDGGLGLPRLTQSPTAQRAPWHVAAHASHTVLPGQGLCVHPSLARKPAPCCGKSWVRGFCTTSSSFGAAGNHLMALPAPKKASSWYFIPWRSEEVPLEGLLRTVSLHGSAPTMRHHRDELCWDIGVTCAAPARRLIALA